MEITGKHVFLGMAGAFGIIIAVNVLMATQALRTFPGLEVKNSYVASQTFDVDRAAQEALGWDVSARVEGSDLLLSISDAAGQPVNPVSVSGTFGRATSVRDDQVPAFVFDGTVLRAPVEAGPGNWNLRLEAVAGNGTVFRQRVIVEHP
ncbi:FixH family protein [Roseisalinus antarcticus]|uniref:FixH n=1 Tax=Roseisalinus antarcticus TaxID=254357 RepID=A0A1Y5S858_9RHOB|nr:FixH family protein [Roseisalinus antarcticus]SLN34019.1 FixH [Roseisalinus antarcticus]